MRRSRDGWQGFRSIETERKAAAAEEVELEGDVLDLLEQLQRVADEMDRLDARRRAATEEKDRVDGVLREAERSLTEKEERAHTLDIERRKRELTIKAEKERMQRVKARMGEVKTSREYQAVLTEISSAKQTVTEQEEALLHEMEELEAGSAEIEDLRAKVREIREALEKAQGDLSAVLGGTEQAILECKSEEDAILRALPIEVVDRYRLIRSRRGGLAVVEARDEACTACFMRIPPQMFIEVIRRGRVIQCPNCQRILIPPKPRGDDHPSRPSAE